MVGVRRSKVKDRSGRTVTRAGMGTPGLMCAVRALNSYQIILSVFKRETEPAEIQAHLAKVHALDTLTTQRRTDRGTGRGLAGTDDELDELLPCQSVFGHDGMWLKERIDEEEQKQREASLKTEDFPGDAAGDDWSGAKRAPESTQRHRFFASSLLSTSSLDSCTASFSFSTLFLCDHLRSGVRLQFC